MEPWHFLRSGAWWAQENDVKGYPDSNMAAYAADSECCSCRTHLLLHFSRGRMHDGACADLGMTHMLTLTSRGWKSFGRMPHIVHLGLSTLLTTCYFDLFGAENFCGCLMLCAPY